jgi:hypothetical protein
MLWKTKYAAVVQLKRKLTMASKHYKENLLVKCFNSILVYRNYRKKKNLQKSSSLGHECSNQNQGENVFVIPGKLDEYYDSQLIYRTYQTWMEKHRIRLEVNNFNKQIEHMQDRFVLARVFEEWKYCKQS